MDKDLLGNPTTDVERDVLRIYEDLKTLAARTDVPPSVARNVRKALSCMWQPVTDLNLAYEHLYDLGV